MYAYKCEGLAVTSIAKIPAFGDGSLTALPPASDGRIVIQLVLAKVAYAVNGPATQNAVCRSGLRSLSAAECYILSRLF